MATEHDDLREQAGLYVLGALTSAERAEFESHLESCVECSAEVRALSRVTDALTYTSPQIDPPAELRGRVLSSISHNATAALPFNRGASAAAQRAPDVRRKVDAPSEGWRASAGARPDRGGRKPEPSLALVLAAAAAIVLAVSLGVYAVQLRGRVGSLEARLHEVQLRADASGRQIADARHAVADAESRVAVLTAPDLARIDLAGQPAAPRAAARAYWSRSRGLVFTASDLPALPPGRVYQLWVLSAQPAPISAGLLRPNASGRVDVVFDTPADLPKPVAMAVTIEPEGGVPAPTGDKYLVGSVATL